VTKWPLEVSSRNLSECRENWCGSCLFFVFLGQRAHAPGGLAGWKLTERAFTQEVTRYAGARTVERAAFLNCASRSLNSFLPYKPLSCSWTYRTVSSIRFPQPTRSNISLKWWLTVCAEIPMNLAMSRVVAHF